MAEVWFYRLSGTPVEAALPDMLEKALGRGWRVLLRCGSDPGLAFLDERLWAYRDESFLPHGLATGPRPERQPVLLTRGRENLNAAQALMLVMGARAGVEEMGGFERTMLVFEEADAQAVAEARDDWRAVLAAGLPAKYWAQDGGRWVQKAGS